MSPALNNIRRTVPGAAPSNNMLQQVLESLGMGGVGGGGNRFAGGGSGGGSGGGGGNFKGPLGGGKNPGIPMSTRLANFNAANPNFFPALTALSLGMGVMNEFADDDPVLRNTGQSVGLVGGGLAGQKIGAVLGGILGMPFGGPVGSSVGALIGGGLGTMAGSQLGSNVLGGVYDAIAGESEDERARRKFLENERIKTKAAAERMQALSPIADKIAQMADARAINVARRNAEIAADMNMYNSLSASRLNAQQNAAQQQALMMQNLF